MKSQSVNVAIICPSLDVEVAKATLLVAAKTAGVSTELLACHDKDTRGFTRTVNSGLRAALEMKISHVCILNDDTNPDQVGWIARLVQVLDSHPKYGIAGPSGMCRSEPQKYGKPGMPKGVKAVLPYNMAFFAVVIKREVFDQTGILDERLIHYGSDNDFCLRADKMGWRVVYVQDVYIKHDLGPIQHRWRGLDHKTYRKLGW